MLVAKSVVFTHLYILMPIKLFSFVGKIDDVQQNPKMHYHRDN